MTSRERVLTAVSHTQPDRTPIGLRFAPELLARIKAHVGISRDADLWDWVGQDLVTVRPTFRQPAADQYYADPTMAISPEGWYLDIYGVPFRPVATDHQVYMELVGHPPLAAARTTADLARYPWPTPDLWDFSTIPPALALHGDKATWARSRGLLEIAGFLRGQEAVLMDLALDPTFAGALLDHIQEGLLALTRLTLDAGGGQYLFYEYNDDVATQRGLLLSPTLWRREVKPRMARFCALIHRYGAKVRYHSCGSVYPIIPDLIEIGVDILNPVQPLAQGMDPFELKAEFGRDLCLDGGVDIQHLLPRGTPKDVSATVRRLCDVVGHDGGYICAGSHTLQADIPVDNMIALVEAAQGR